MLIYNHKSIHSVTKFTPNNARKKENHFDVKINLLLHKQHNRKYPPLKEGDQVKIYKKKDKKHQKEHYSVWSQNSYKIDDEIISMGQTFYKIAGFPKMYMRHELLKV